jgi:putative membrane-bound dehydrogenase-like protein
MSLGLRASAFGSVALLSLLAVVAPAADVPKSPLSPEDSLRWFELDEGLRIELAAAEPEIVDPVAVKFDEQGRMWVAEYRDYPNGPAEGGKPLSRIKLLEDTDHDGRFETAHVFAEGLSFCNGIQPYNGGVIATMAGSVSFLKDTDGDHKADVVETWYTGFAQENPQLRVNHPRFGLDNHIYVANGLRGGEAVDARDPKAKPVSLRGHDLRFDPRTGKYEAIAGNGQFGLTFDDYANRFLVTNRNPLIQVMLEDRYTARNPNLALPAVVQDAAVSGEASRVYSILPTAWTTSILHAGQFTAACGIDIYRGDLLPPEYYGNSFTCEPTGSLVHREVLTAQGATFVGKSPYDKREFLASRDSWFRPVYCENGPDGALYVCDMYRAVIEHPQFMPEELKNRPDLRHGDDRGRVYRIVPKDFACKKETKTLAETATADLVATLDHANAWHRETTQRLLIERNDAAAVDPLKKLAGEARTPQGKVHALWTLAGLGRLDASLIAAALEDSHPRVREQAIVLSERVAADDANVRKLIITQARDADARLRFQAALTLGNAATPDDATLTALVDVLERGADDPWTRAAVGTAAPHDTVRILSIVIARTKPTAGDEAARRRALLRDLAFHAGRKIDAAAAAELKSSLKPWETSDEGRQLILAVLAGLGKGLKGQWATLFDAEQLAKVRSEVLATAASASVAKEHRLDALEILATVGGDATEVDAAALNILKTDADGELRSKALALVASRRSAETGPLLLSLLAKQTPAVRGQIFDALLSRPERVTVLLDAMESGKLKPRELDQTRATRLLKTTDPKLKARAEKLLASAMPADRTKALEQYRAALSLKADPHRGKEVFKKNCATCHKVGDVGIEVGPSIADLRTKTLEQVLVDVLQPNKAIDNNFVSYTVVTDDGVQYVGIIAAETPGSVTLKMPDGKTQSILKTEIDEMSSNGVSLMPEGIERNIPLQDMADVISFVKNWRYLDGSVPEAPGAPTASAAK